jgi:hypothetical protein
MYLNHFELESEIRAQKEELDRRIRETETYNLYSKQIRERKKYQVKLFGLKLSL